MNYVTIETNQGSRIHLEYKTEDELRETIITLAKCLTRNTIDDTATMIRMALIAAEEE